jgi:hypothetical protein
MPLLSVSGLDKTKSFQTKRTLLRKIRICGKFVLNVQLSHIVWTNSESCHMRKRDLEVTLCIICIIFICICMSLYVKFYMLNLISIEFRCKNLRKCECVYMTSSVFVTCFRAIKIQQCNEDIYWPIPKLTSIGSKRCRLIGENCNKLSLSAECPCFCMVEWVRSRP